MRHYYVQLNDTVTGQPILTSGGVVYVAEAGGEAKVSLLDRDGASASNPSTLTRGMIDFYVADSVASVDLYIQAPSGHGLVVKGLAASGPNTVFVDKSRSDTMLIIPWSSADSTDATETDTGFDLLVNSLVMPVGIGVDVTNASSTDTIDLGFLNSESSGDANGLITQGDIGTIQSIAAGVVSTSGSSEKYLSSTTLGLLIDPQFVAGADDGNADVGTTNPQPYRCNGTNVSLSYTYTAGTDAAVGEGFFKIPLQLPIASL